MVTSLLTFYPELGFRFTVIVLEKIQYPKLLLHNQHLHIVSIESGIKDKSIPYSINHYFKIRMDCLGMKPKTWPCILEGCLEVYRLLLLH